MTQYTQQEMAVHARLTTDFPFYARHCLKIKTKTGNIEPFILNDAQVYIHRKLEEQLATIGMVRAIIVKGRQQGCSTYLEGRYYQKTSLDSAKTVCILSHETKSTQSLFDKVDMYYRMCPAQMKPGLRASNKHELKFDNESEYMVATAGSENTGRSRTAQYLHASEAAFFPDDASIAAGLFQIVADMPGTEIVKESTGNGMNGFYRDVMDALAGKGKYIVIFVPWFWQSEYRTQPAKDFELTEEELVLVDRFNLDWAQLQWRRDKIVELKSLRMFKQEYPCTLQEAFQTSGNCFYDIDLVTKAMKSGLDIVTGPLILGVDPARKGDRTVLCLRKGRRILEIIKYDEMDTMQLAGIISRIIDTRGVDKCFIDYGLGYGTVDRLRERGYGRVVEGVHFGESPINPQFLNKRAEMAFEFRDWMADGEVRMPDDDDIAMDIASMPDFKLNSRGRLFFPDKDKIKEAYGRSPDILDAIMLTFAYPVANKEADYDEPQHTANTKNGSQLSTLRRVRSDSQSAGRLRRVK